MDQIFDMRRRYASPPFDGSTLVLHNFAPLPSFQKIVAIVAERLHKDNSESELFKLEDWHEHDGFQSDPSPTNWQELLTLVGSEENLREARAGDALVRTCFFPLERDWYLRLYIPDIYDNPFGSNGDEIKLVDCGIFDLSASESTLKELETTLNESLGAGVERVPAKEFFDRSYAGKSS